MSEPRHIPNRHDTRRARRAFPACAALNDFVFRGGRSRSPSFLTPSELAEAHRLAAFADDEISRIGAPPPIPPEVSRYLAEVVAEIASRGRAAASVSLFCAALAGSWTDEMRALLADPDGVSVLLDLAEERSGAWPVVSCEWPVVERHEHVWLPVGRDLDGRRWQSPVWKRCPCGTYAHEDDAGRWVPWQGAGSPVVDDCHDRNCQREAGHRGLHMSRTWDSWNAQEIVDEWGDVAPPASAAP